MSDHDERSMSGLSVLIAGATGGLGSSIARDLARRGARPTLVARRDDRLADVDAPGGRLAWDLRDPDAGHLAVPPAGEQGGRLDVVVNAVGPGALRPVVGGSVARSRAAVCICSSSTMHVRLAAGGAIGGDGPVPHASAHRRCWLQV